MAVSVFDIFSGILDRGPRWLTSAPSPSEASDRMRELAAKKPGPYFVYCCETRAVLESIDTSATSATDGPHSPPA